MSHRELFRVEGLPVLQNKTYELIPYFPALLERLLGWLGVLYVVDYDDALFDQYDRQQNRWVHRLLGQKIPRVMRSAHLMTAGNAYLAGGGNWCLTPFTIFVHDPART